MFLFTCFYAPLQPVILWFTTFALYKIKDVQKITLFKLRSRPIPGTSKINTAMYHFIYAGPLFYSLGSICVSNIYGDFKYGHIPNGISLILSLCIILAPYKEIVNTLKENYKPVRSSYYKSDRYFLTS